MTHLRIEQNNIQENVSSAVIKKLYDIATSGTLDASSHLAGNLYVPATYQEYIDVLTDQTNPKFRDLTITAGKIYLQFRDPEVFRVLMATGHIGDGVGITQSDCANYGDYTMYGAPYTIFQNNTTIEYFPELRYFTYWSNHTNLSSSAFNGCTNLKNIDVTGWTSIPTAFVSGCPLSEFNIQSLSGITYIGQFGFQNSGISGELSLPNLTNTDTNIFYGCTGLTKILSLGNITQIKDNSFRGCTGLTSVVFPNTLTDIGSSAFCGCSGLTSIDLSSTSVTTIRGSAFLDTSLTTVSLPQAIRNLSDACFNNISTLTTINTENVTIFGNNCLSSTRITNLNISSATSIGGRAFGSVNDIVLTLPQNNWAKPNAYTDNAFFNGTFTSITNINALENYDYVTMEFPGFGTSSQSIDVINFKNATSTNVSCRTGGLFSRDSTKFIRQMYIPKLTGTADRLFGIGAQNYQQSHEVLRIKLIYFKDITTFHTTTFFGGENEAIVINNTTPPTASITYYKQFWEWQGNVYGANIDVWGNFSDAQNPEQAFNPSGGNQSMRDVYAQNKVYVGPNITAIYVPDSAVNTYKAASGWTPVASIIKPISELNGGVIYANKTDWETDGKPVGLIADHLGLTSGELSSFVSANNLSYYSA